VRYFGKDLVVLVEFVGMVLVSFSLLVVLDDSFLHGGCSTVVGVGIGVVVVGVGIVGGGVGVVWFEQDELPMFSMEILQLHRLQMRFEVGQECFVFHAVVFLEMFSNDNGGFGDALFALVVEAIGGYESFENAQSRNGLMVEGGVDDVVWYLFVLVCDHEGLHVFLQLLSWKSIAHVVLPLLVDKLAFTGVHMCFFGGDGISAPVAEEDLESFGVTEELR